jgi:hypothetical protein
MWISKGMQCTEADFANSGIKNRELIEPSGLNEKWEKITEELTSRDITKITDRLLALSGLADKRQRETGDTCLAGLWKSNLKKELLWQVAEEGTSFRVSGSCNAPT